MSRLSSTSLCFIVFCVTFHTSTTAQALLRVGYIERPPHIFANADGSIRGLTGKRLVELFSQSGVEADLIRTYQEDIGEFIGNTRLDAFIATKTLIDSPDQFLFSKTPLFKLQFYAYHRSDTPALNALANLTNVSIILPIPLDAFTGPLKEQITAASNQVSVVAEVSNLETQLAMLRRNKADYAISYLDENTVAMMFSQRTNRSDVLISRLFELPMYLVVRREFSNAESIIEKINTRLNGKLINELF